MNIELEERVKNVKDELPWQNLMVRWLAHADLGSSLGCGVELSIPAGQSYDIHRHQGIEMVVYVSAGSGLHKGTGGDRPLAKDDLLVLTKGEWHGFTNTSDAPAKIWLLYAPVAHFPLETYEVAGAASDFSGELVARNLYGVADDPTISVPEKGFVNMDVIWDGAAGADQITFGIAFFKKGARHKWHRHPRGDEIIYTVSGHWAHVTEAHRVPMETGSFEFSPAGEFHTAETEQEKADVIFVYFGGSSLESVGYDRKLDA